MRGIWAGGLRGRWTITSTPSDESVHHVHREPHASGDLGNTARGLHPLLRHKDSSAIMNKAAKPWVNEAVPASRTERASSYAAPAATVALRSSVAHGSPDGKGSTAVERAGLVPNRVAVVDDSRAMFFAWRVALRGQADVAWAPSPEAFWAAYPDSAALELLKAVIIDHRFVGSPTDGVAFARELAARAPRVLRILSSCGVFAPEELTFFHRHLADKAPVHLDVLLVQDPSRWKGT